mmetsp:Transcript_23030/g.26492  ORF Transcript_23030/g.26492 Transcript_23030/m.26492 type:complete len:91 (-) Transcript_23030:1002-1274(-)
MDKNISLWHLVHSWWFVYKIDLCVHFFTTVKNHTHDILGGWCHIISSYFSETPSGTTAHYRAIDTPTRRKISRISCFQKVLPPLTNKSTN